MPEAPSNKPSGTSGAPSPELLGIARGIGGALLGAAAGVVVFIVLGKIPVYAIAAIGVLTGLGCSLLSQRRSLLLGVVSLAVALVTTFFNEWINNPFNDPSLSFFLAHIGPKTNFWLSIVLGGGLAFWFGQGNERTTPRGGS